MYFDLYRATVGRPYLEIGNCLIDFGITFGVILVNFGCVYALAFLKIETC